MNFEIADPEEILSALGALLRSRPPLFLVVIGGSAIAVRGLIARTTRDIDVLGQAIKVHSGLIFGRFHDWPEWIIEAAETVRRDFGLESDWLNLDAANIPMTLPAGFMDRLLVKVYGDCLTVGFASRYDLIHFKLYAAVEGDERHLQDLEKLRPTADEIRAAVDWLNSFRESPGNIERIRKILIRFGYEFPVE